MSASDPLAHVLLASFRHSFTSYKDLADRALTQLTPAAWLFSPAPGANSIAVIVQHLAGNIRSRFSDFLTSDGEKPDRRRDQEFEEPTDDTIVPALHQQWEEAWDILFALLDTLQPDDLLRTVTIRGEAHTVLAALQRQVGHYAYHTGQMVQLAKHLRGLDWHTLSIPRGQSEQYTLDVQRRSDNHS